MIYDIGIIGAGVAGVFALHNLLNNNEKNIILFEAGRTFMKRRHQIYGSLGCLLSSDGKLYTNDLDKLSPLIGPKKTKKYYKNVLSLLKEVADLKMVKDKNISKVLERKIKKSKYEILYNNYIQLYPKDIHNFSRFTVKKMDANTLLDFVCDNEVTGLKKYKNSFIVSTLDGEYQCKKIILCIGRGGWRFNNELYRQFGLIKNNDYAQYGIRIELDQAYMQDFNYSHCSLFRDNIMVGPFGWNGTTIMEDMLDCSISSFRSNEERWISDNVSFDLIGNIYCKDNGFEQVDRLAKLTFIICNDRVSREKLSLLVSNKSKLSIIPEYNWISEQVNKLNHFIPELISKGIFYAPTIIPTLPKIKLTKNLETEVKGLYVAGESAGVIGLLAAGITGLVASDGILK